DPQLALPKPFPFREVVPTPEQLDWLQRMGVTHIMSVVPLNSDVWPIQALGRRPDAFLNPVFVMTPTQSLFLYELTNTRGRVAWLENREAAPPRILEYTPQRVAVTADSAEGGSIVLTDLDYPGWQVTVDGHPVEREANDGVLRGVGQRGATRVIDGMLRGVTIPPGEHQIVWRYAPLSIKAGALISLLTLVGGSLWFWRAR
ncbi:MAG: YfhO family protein, partial [Planctomycetes bacterium]|nr:YfhO family protein [Planctomycetota bacterium]